MAPRVRRALLSACPLQGRHPIQRGHNQTPDESLGYIDVLFACFGRKIDGPGSPGGLIIYQGHLFPLKDTHAGIEILHQSET